MASFAFRHVIKMSLSLIGGERVRYGIIIKRGNAARNMARKRHIKRRVMPEIVGPSHLAKRRRNLPPPTYARDHAAAAAACCLRDAMRHVDGGGDIPHPGKPAASGAGIAAMLGIARNESLGNIIAPPKSTWRAERNARAR